MAHFVDLQISFYLVFERIQILRNFPMMLDSLPWQRIRSSINNILIASILTFGEVSLHWLIIAMPNLDRIRSMVWWNQNELSITQVSSLSSDFIEMRSPIYSYS